MATPENSIIICATPRSGSYLLCESLRVSGRGGAPEEYLWKGNAEQFGRSWRIDHEHASAYRGAMLRAGTGSNGVLGCKVMWGYAASAARVMCGLPWGATDESGTGRNLDGLLHGFANPTWVFMCRRDTAAQAVSYSRAIQQDAWAQLADGSRVPGDSPVLDQVARGGRTSARDGASLRYDFHQIDFYRHQIEQHNEAWLQWFRDNDVEPLRVDYEGLVADYEGTALRVLQAASIDTAGIEFGERGMQKQRDHVSRRWLLRYREDARAAQIALQLDANG